MFIFLLNAFYHLGTLKLYGLPIIRIIHVLLKLAMWPFDTPLIKTKWLLQDARCSLVHPLFFCLNPAMKRKGFNKFERIHPVGDKALASRDGLNDIDHCSMLQELLAISLLQPWYLLRSFLSELTYRFPCCAIIYCMHLRRGLSVVVWNPAGGLGVSFFVGKTRAAMFLSSLMQPYSPLYS